MNQAKCRSEIISSWDCVYCQTASLSVRNFENSLCNKVTTSCFLEQVFLRVNKSIHEITRTEKQTTRNLPLFISCDFVDSILGLWLRLCCAHRSGTHRFQLELDNRIPSFIVGSSLPIFYRSSHQKKNGSSPLVAIDTKALQALFHLTRRFDSFFGHRISLHKHRLGSSSKCPNCCAYAARRCLPG